MYFSYWQSLYIFFGKYASAYTHLRYNGYTVLGVKAVNVKDAVAKQFQIVCSKRGIRIKELANMSGVTPSTAYSMMDSRRRDISIATIKKFCDGLDISLGEFFSAPIFDELEQEIR